MTIEPIRALQLKKIIAAVAGMLKGFGVEVSELDYIYDAIRRILTR